jgi:hypothetical protein
MKAAKSICAVVLFLHLIAFVLPGARACTIFSYSRGGSVLVGNNEDVPFLPQAAMWFVPANTNGYGRVCFGWNGFAQGGMNDQGLFIDWAVTPESETRAWKRTLAWIRLGIEWVATPKNSPPVKFAQNDSHKLRLPLNGNASELLLANCATVDEAIAFAKRFKYPGNPVPGNPCHCLIASRSGESVVCEWIKGKPTIIRKTGSRQLITNFLLSKPKLGNYPCTRFDAVSKWFDDSETPTVQVCADALKLAANGGTVYSQVYDLPKGDVYVYYRHNFDHSVKVNLAEELSKGPHQVMLKEAFQDPTESLSVPKITATATISAEEILRKALEARGGATSAQNIHSIHAQGVVDLDLGWVAASPIELFAMSPNLYRTVLDEKSPVGLKLGEHAEGFNGRKGWSAEPGAAPQILKGKVLRQRRDDAAFFAWYDAPTNYKSAVCLGEASFEGRTCYAVDMMTQSRREEIHYYDTNSFLLSGIMEVAQTGFGPALKETKFGDYREFGGFLLPTRIGWQSVNTSGTIRYNSIELNDVEESALKMPIQSAAQLGDSRRALLHRSP